jgi:hypothetical protein
MRRFTSSHAGQYVALRGSSLASKLGVLSGVDEMGPSAGNDSAESQDLQRLSAVVIALQTEAETQGPNSTPPDGKNDAKSAEAPQGVEPSVAPTWHARPRSSNRFHFVLLAAMPLIAVGVGWSAGRYFHMATATAPAPAAQEVNIDAVVDQIIKVESNGDANAKNKRSSATGLGQFLNETWLLLIRAHRPDLVTERTEAEVLDLRRDPSIAREITARFTERNANVLKRRGLAVTPGTLYLAHFAGAAGAVAVLSALDEADAATTMASADATGRTKREKLVNANPFLLRFTVADLKSWADRKMRTRSSSII